MLCSVNDTLSFAIRAVEGSRPLQSYMGVL